ncbi:putative amino acid transporter, transmembrane domain-containing protein [Helianthus annuus]|nr:putative amino acid transporter, transmembrane domain-containing protein [Helianthus annuus]
MGPVHFVLSHLPNFNSLSGISLAAAIMSLSYSTIAWGASLDKGVQPNVEYGYKAKSTTGTVFNFLSALGDMAFAYAGHNVVLEIQATIPSTPEKPSKGPMWKGVVVAYIVIALCYFPVAFIGYWVFGNGVDDNILITLEKPTWLIAMANMFVVVHVIGSYQLYAMPVFDMMETLLEFASFLWRTTWILWRTCICPNNILFALHHVALHMYNLEDGAYLGLPIGSVLLLGVVLMVVAPIGGLRSIIVQAKTYKFFS